MRLLLDTHVYLWWLQDHQNLSKTARDRIASASQVDIGSASIWEASIKVSIGKLDPFDRILVAQALCEPLRLLTADSMLGGYSELVETI